MNLRSFVVRGAAGVVAGVALAAGLVVGAIGAGAGAQPPGRSPLAPPANGPRHGDSTWHAFTNATVHISPERTVENATVVIREGRIVSVQAAPGPRGDGKAVSPAAPAGARVWDCAGLHIYPGFIDAYVEVDAPRPDANSPGVHWSVKVTPQRAALDGTGIDEKTAESLRKLGFAAAAMSPAGGVFRGTSAVVSLAKPSSESSLERPPVYLAGAYQSVAFETRARRPRVEGQPRERETPDVQRWSGYPDSQMGAIALIRQTLIDAEWHALHGRGAGASCLDALAVDRRRSETARQRASETGAEVGDRGNNRPLLFDTEDELEALRAARVAKEFSRPAILLGSGTEFRRLAAIKEDGLPVVLPLRYPRTPDVATVGKADAVELRELMTWEQAPTNARRLDEAGVRVALTTAKLRNRAEFEENLRAALRHGLKPQRALAMLTTQPAELLGVADRLGTIEAGKQANLVIAEEGLFEAWPVKRGTEGRRDEGTKGEEKKEGEKTQQPVPPVKPPPAEGQKPGGKEGEPEKRPEPPAAQAPAEPDAPDAAEGERAGGDDSAGGERGRGEREKKKSKIREVWIDGVRHEVNRAPAKDVHGTWKIVAIEGREIDEPDDVAVFFTVTPEGAVTYRRAGKTEKATNVKISEGRLEYTIDAKKLFDIPAVLIDQGIVEGDLMHGITPMPGGKVHRWTAKRVGEGTEGRRDGATKGNEAGAPPREREARGREAANEAIDDPKVPPALHAQVKEYFQKLEEPGARGDAEPRKSAEQEEREAIASVPEKYGYPFGPYMLEQVPRQPSLIEIRGATIWTSGPSGLLRPEDGGTLIRIEKGKITYVGRDLPGEPPPPGDPADSVRIDGTGKHIAPGIIDCHSHTGISKGINEAGQAVTAEVRIGDVTDPDAVSWYRQLAAGVTAVNTLHGSANAIGGQNQVNKIRWGVPHPDMMHMEGARPGIKFALGENPKQSNWGDQNTARYPQTRMGVEMLIRDRFTAAKDYLAEQRTREAMQERVEPHAHVSIEPGGVSSELKIKMPDPGTYSPAPLPPRRDLELEALAEILEGKRLIHCHSYRQDEILMLCRVAEEFGFKIGTFQHVLEGYKVADEIARTALGGSCFSDWWAYKVEVQDAIPANGPIMAEQGVCVSFNSDSDELARRLNTEAAKATKYGKVPPAEALKYVTLNPAKQLAVEGRVGSLEPGKDADFAIWSGPPMSAVSRCEATYVDGRRLFSLEDDKAHRQRIQKERHRLIQKALGAAKRKPPEGGREQGERGLGGPWQRPTEDDGERRRGGMLERHYLDIMNRGGDPEAARPGECGCGLWH
ncbi:MAG: amidohydrolase family protein [Phycisphaerales bacterium]